ncbi:MAG: hypothetical protein R3E82_19430 [Pseudomonadales bacterium]
MDSRTDNDSNDHNPQAKAPIRSQLECDVDAFLREGGVIRELRAGERADPPKRPESNYGRGAI